MPSSTAKKLKIRESDRLLAIHAPSDFKKRLGELPSGVKIIGSGKKYSQIHWFVLNKAVVDNELQEILKLLCEDVLCWVYFPKGSSGLQTDLTRDKGWDELLKNDLQWLTLISLDDTWSAFGFRSKTVKDDKKTTRPRERPILEYIDPVKKTIRLPDDFSTGLAKDKKAEIFFQTLSFSNKKEYLEWIVSAKRPGTRDQRVKGSLERLRKGWKNPRNL